MRRGNGDPDVENGLADTAGEGESGADGESGLSARTLSGKVESWWKVPGSTGSLGRSTGLTNGGGGVGAAGEEGMHG